MHAQSFQLKSSAISNAFPSTILHELSQLTCCGSRRGKTLERRILPVVRSWQPRMMDHHAALPLYCRVGAETEHMAGFFCACAHLMDWWVAGRGSSGAFKRGTPRDRIDLAKQSKQLAASVALTFPLRLPHGVVIHRYDLSSAQHARQGLSAQISLELYVPGTDRIRNMVHDCVGVLCRVQRCV